MENGFVKLHRSVLEHEWLNDKPEWFMAWSHILLETNYKTGHVNLTEVYRGLTRHFTKNQWRYFVKRLEKDEMLEGVESVNLGSLAGFRQTGTVKNWFLYHRKQDAAEDAANDVASTQPETQQNGVQDTENGPSERSPKRDLDAASTQPETLSNKNNTSLKKLKEVKEKPLRGKQKKYKPEKADLPPSVNTELWADWCKMRSEIKKPLTPTTVKGQLKLLEANASDANTILERSIRNGWQGLFPLDSRRTSEGSAPPAEGPMAQYVEAGL